MDSRPWHRSYDKGVPASLEDEPLTLPGLLAATTAAHGSRTALVFEGTRRSYAQVSADVDRMAAALTGLGLKPGDAVAVHLPNLPQAVVSIFAVLACGGRVVMTNPLYTPPEIEHQWTDAGCQIAVTTDFLLAGPLAGFLSGQGSRLGIRHWIVASIPEALPWPKRWLAPLVLRRRDPPAWAPVPRRPDVHRFSALLASTRAAPPRPALRPEDAAVIQYTGGTTGVSKGAVLSHRNLVTNARQVEAWLAPLAAGPQVVLAALPLFHVFGLSTVMILAVRMGSTLVLAPNPRDVGALAGAVEREQVTVLPAVPAMLDALAALAEAQGCDLSSVRGVFSGSAPLTEASQRRFEQLTGAVVFEGYGLTETSPVTHCNPVAGVRKTGTVGLPLPDTDARLADPGDASRDAPAGEAGELLVRGPQIMQGYWNRPDETAAAMHGDWFCTGDLAVMDDDGCFAIVGRKKDMILCSGYNVYPDEVDRVLGDHPAVAESCTIGVPDVKRGETVKAFVVLKPGASADAAALDAHCRARLAAYKVPRDYVFREALPRSSMLKLLRRTLRDEELARQAASKA